MPSDQPVEPTTTLTKHGADGTSHEHVLGAVVHVDVDDALADGLADFGPQQDGAHGFKDGGQDAGLPQGHHPGAHGRAEGVGHVVGPHGEGQDERDDEAEHQQPQVGRHVRLGEQTHRGGGGEGRYRGPVHRERRCVYA